MMYIISCQKIQICRFQDASMQLVHGIGNGKHQPTATNSEVVVSGCCPSSQGKNYAGAMKNGKSGSLRLLMYVDEIHLSIDILYICIYIHIL